MSERLILTGLRASVHGPRPDPAAPPGYAGPDSAVFVFLRATTADGLTGIGATGRFLAAEVAHFLNGALGEVTAGADAADPELLATLARRFNPRGMTGVAVSALSALDVALHDLRAQAAGLPLHMLLGGARDAVPAHVTCGLPHLETAALVEACGREVAAGATGVKMLVGARGRSVAEDAARVAAARGAIGDADLIVDANCAFDLETARALARAMADQQLAWFEEPVRGNDVRDLAALRADGACRIGAGQMEQSAERFRQLQTDAGLDVIQPNVVFAGGFGAAIAAGRAATAAGRLAAPAGGWDAVNLAMMAGAFESGPIELHRGQAAMIRTLFAEPPTLGADGALRPPERPGLGYDIDEAELLAARL